MHHYISVHISVNIIYCQLTSGSGCANELRFTESSSVLNNDGPSLAMNRTCKLIVFITGTQSIYLLKYDYLIYNLELTRKKKIEIDVYIYIYCKMRCYDIMLKHIAQLFRTRGRDISSRKIHTMLDDNIIYFLPTG